jgi:hypothetical protein
VLKKIQFQALQTGLLIAAALVLLSIAWKPLLIDGLLPLDGNMFSVTYPNWSLARSLWEAPRIPLWNPWRNMGAPHLADPITSALYPIQWVLSAFHGFPDFFRSWVVLHTLIASLFAALLAHRWYQDDSASAAAAVLAGLNGFFMARSMFPHNLAAAAWLPAILYFNDRRMPKATAACLSLQWLAGYPPFFCISLLAAGLLSLQNGREAVKSFFYASALSLFFSAVQIVPFLEFLGRSTRGVVLDPLYAAQFSIPLKQLIKEVFLPQWYGLSPQIPGDPAMLCFYIGPFALALAAWGGLRAGKRERLIAAATALCFVFSLGRYLPGYRHMLFLHVFRSPCNWLLGASLGASMLCACGISRLPSMRWRWILVAAIALDLAWFARSPKSAWARPGFLTAAPPLAQAAQSLGRTPRIYHTEHLMRTWSKGVLNGEEDYLLMRDFLAPSYGTAFRIGDISNYQTLRPKGAELYSARMAMENGRQRLLDAAGVSLVVSLEDDAGRVERRYLRIRRNPTAKERIFLEDPSRGRVLRFDHSPGAIRAVIEASSPGLVVFSEGEYPGWHAFVDGTEVPHRRYEEMFLSAAVASGRHEIAFDFSPLSFWIGLALTLLSLAFAAVRALRAGV